MATAKRNPEGMLLLAAGAALLMRGMSTSSNGRSKASGQGRSRQRAQNGGNGQGGRSGDDRAEEQADAMSATRRYAREVTDTIGTSARNVADTIGTSASHVAETISGSASRVAAYAEDIGSTAWEGSTSLIDDATRSIRGGVARLVEEQPLAVAVLGFAAGAVAAGAIPASRVEREALRPVGQRLAATARQAQGRFESAAKKAGDRLGELADEHGLNAEGLEKSAGEVAEAFSEGFGQDQDKAGLSSAAGEPAREQTPAKQQGDPLSSAAAATGADRAGAQEGGAGGGQRKPTNGTE